MRPRHTWLLAAFLVLGGGADLLAQTTTLQSTSPMTIPAPTSTEWSAGYSQTAAFTLRTVGQGKTWQVVCTNIGVGAYGSLLQNLEWRVTGQPTWETGSTLSQCPTNQTGNVNWGIDFRVALDSAKHQIGGQYSATIQLQTYQWLSGAWSLVGTTSFEMRMDVPLTWAITSLPSVNQGNYSNASSGLNGYLSPGGVSSASYTGPGSTQKDLFIRQVAGILDITTGMYYAPCGGSNAGQFALDSWRLWDTETSAQSKTTDCVTSNAEFRFPFACHDYAPGSYSAQFEVELRDAASAVQASGSFTHSINIQTMLYVAVSAPTIDFGSASAFGYFDPAGSATTASHCGNVSHSVYIAADDAFMRDIGGVLTAKPVGDLEFNLGGWTPITTSDTFIESQAAGTYLLHDGLDARVYIGTGDQTSVYITYLTVSVIAN